jgi:magnesium transporter
VEILTSVDREKIAELRREDHFFWLDLANPSEHDLDMLGEMLDLHPLALEDTREWNQRPKLDRYEHHVLLVFYSARTRTPEDERGFTPLEVHIYISGSFIVTARHEPCSELDALHHTLTPEKTDVEEYLVYRILDGLTDAFYPVIDAIETQVDAMEREVLAHPRPQHLGSIYRLKQDVHDLLRRATPQRDLFTSAGTYTISSLPGLSRGSHEYLRDVADHLAQVVGELNRQNEDLVALTSTYFNANSNRLNRTASRLSVVGTFFIAWTLVTGFFGQNFGWLVDHVASLHSFVIYGIGGLGIPTIVLGIYFWRRREDWL